METAENEKDARTQRQKREAGAREVEKERKVGGLVCTCGAGRYYVLHTGRRTFFKHDASSRKKVELTLLDL